MGTIIAGRFDTQQEAESARERLLAAGFADDAIEIFFNNPPGRHDLAPQGGDEHADPDARAAGHGASTGAVLGAGAGVGLGIASAAALTGPIGVAAAAALTGVGAYVGSLAGAVAEAKEKHTELPLRRPAGEMIAVHVGDSNRDETAIEVLRTLGAHNIERSEGEWRDGNWADFDPLARPNLVNDTIVQAGPAPSA